MVFWIIISTMLHVWAEQVWTFEWGDCGWISRPHDISFFWRPAVIKIDFAFFSVTSSRHANKYKFHTAWYKKEQVHSELVYLLLQSSLLEHHRLSTVKLVLHQCDNVCWRLKGIRWFSLWTFCWSGAVLPSLVRFRCNQNRAVAAVTVEYARACPQKHRHRHRYRHSRTRARARTHTHTHNLFKVYLIFYCMDRASKN